MMSAFEYELDNQLKLYSFRDINGNELKGQPLVLDNAVNQLKMEGLHIDGHCISKNLVECLGGFRPDMRYNEITEFRIRCATMQPSGHLPQSIVSCRRRA